jgi:hypothetical protein
VSSLGGRTGPAPTFRPRGGEIHRFERFTLVLRRVGPAIIVTNQHDSLQRLLGRTLQGKIAFPASRLTSACSCRARRAPGSAQELTADGGQRSVEFGTAGTSPAADAHFR